MGEFAQRQPGSSELEDGGLDLSVIRRNIAAYGIWKRHIPAPVPNEPMPRPNKTTLFVSIANVQFT